MIICPANQWTQESFSGSLDYLAANELARRSLTNAYASPRLSVRREAVERDVLRAMLDAMVPAGCS